MEGKLKSKSNASRAHALEELKDLSVELYEKAIIPDSTPYPLQLKPPTDTPPNPEYERALTLKLQQGTSS